MPRSAGAHATPKPTISISTVATTGRAAARRTSTARSTTSGGPPPRTRASPAPTPGSRRGAANLDRRVDCFRRATAKDPSFARARAGLALAYVVIPAFDVNVPSDSLYELASSSANRALALQPGIADAHLALANVNTR